MGTRFNARPERVFARAAILLLALGVVPAVALAASEQVTVPLSPGALAHPCTGELVVVTGTIHTTFRTTESSSGNVSVTTTSNTQGVTGTGAPSGAKYTLAETQMSSFSVAKGSTSTNIISFRFLRSGETGLPDDFTLHTRFHLTVNANGVPTATVDQFSATCDGIGV
jgi:hypothetical protein